MVAPDRDPARWGIIGGTGLDAFDTLEVERVQHVDTPYGPVSAPLTFALLAGTPVVFLPRHGAAHHQLGQADTQVEEEKARPPAGCADDRLSAYATVFCHHGVHPSTLGFDRSYGAGLPNQAALFL